MPNQAKKEWTMGAMGMDHGGHARPRRQNSIRSAISLTARFHQYNIACCCGGRPCAWVWGGSSRMGCICATGTATCTREADVYGTVCVDTI